LRSSEGWGSDRRSAPGNTFTRLAITLVFLIVIVIVVGLGAVVRSFRSA
jgi:hypothetical protein